MKISIDGNQINPLSVTYNDGLGYGRLDGVDIHSYSMLIRRHELLQSLDTIYQEVMEEIRRDDELVQDSSTFKEMGYVSLNEAFEHSKLLEEAISTYFDRDIFRLYLTMSSSSEYIINSTDRVVVTESELLLEGRCFKRRK